MLDSDEQRVVDDVAEFGWHSIFVDEDHHGPAFVYSVGFMHTTGHPEVIMMGLPRELMHNVLWGIFRAIKKGTKFGSGKHDDLLENYPCTFRVVHEEQHPLYLGYAMWFCRHQKKIGTLQALQCIWPDKSGLFPFEDGCHENARRRQPLLFEPPLTI